ncbi:MAG: ANTAR domain-containing protein [Lachnospiraceae bacterium]|nr:ANTAR domain-containing protein [Lachnospiraceae bacterium]
MTNIIVGFPDETQGRSIRNLLVRSGFNCIGVCTTGAQIMSLTDDLMDGIVVCGYKFSDMMYNELKENLGEEFELLLLTKRASIADRADTGVVCVEMPLKTSDLIDTLGMMVEHAERRRRKRREKPRVRTKEELAVIEYAKRVLMERNSMSEKEAHRYLQKCSMDSGTNLAESARMVIDLMS